MRSITSYIKESVDDNLLWKLDKWFELYPDERSEFSELIVLYNNDKSAKALEEFIKGSFYFSRNYREFINFMTDEIKPTLEKEYFEDLKNILNYIIDNKSKRNKYKNCVAN